MLKWLARNDPFPPVESALIDPNGLLAAGGDLSANRILDAYRHGIFPWYGPEDPILWWSPDPRMVLFPHKLRVSRSLNKSIRRGGYEIRVDTAFRTVMEKCAEPRSGQRGTWISDAMISAYCELFELGLAHSIETWIDGELAGGLYGISLGRVFFGESMFTRATDASKIAFVHLVRQLEHWEYELIDCQMKTAHLASFGAEEIPRTEYVRAIAASTELPGKTGKWRFDHEPLEH